MSTHTKETFQAVVLAAGNSSRFCTTDTKLSFLLCGQELIVYPLMVLKQLQIPTIVVVGHQQEIIKNIVHKHALSVQLAQQAEQRGTGHAVQAAQSYWTADNLIILNGDVPLIDQQLLNSLIDHHIQQQATLSFVTAYKPIPAGQTDAYGRVVKQHGITKVIEARDFNAIELKPQDFPYINAGIYIVRRTFIEHALQTLKQHSQQELYITDLIERASQTEAGITIVEADFDHVRGVNTLQELHHAEQLKKQGLIHYWMNRGVRFIDPPSVHLDITVSISPDTTIEPGVILKGTTTIGHNCTIEAYSRINNSVIHDFSCILSHSVIDDSIIQAHTNIGPFAHIRKQSTIGSQSTIGNFVEVSQSSIGAHTKAKHLTYLGTAHIGSFVNIGAGTITCNYNGVTKHATHIQDYAFIGSQTALVAPITIGQSALTGAGSTITANVPSQALAIARAYQVTKPEYAPQLKEKYQQEADKQQAYLSKKNKIEQEKLL